MLIQLPEPSEFLLDTILEIRMEWIATGPSRFLVFKRSGLPEPGRRRWWRVECERISYDEWQITVHGITKTELIDDQRIQLYRFASVTHAEEVTTIHTEERARLRFSGGPLRVTAERTRLHAGQEVVKRWLCFETRRFEKSD